MGSSRLKFAFFVLVVLAINQKCDQTRLRFTNIICNCTDRSYAHVDRCEMKSESKNVQYFTAKVTVYHLPVTDITIRVQLMTRVNEWKPFMYEQIIRCNFTRVKNYLTNYVWNMVRNVSNIKTDCPYNQYFDLPRVTNTFIESALKKLPVPPGRYGVFITIETYNKIRGLLTFQISLE